MVKMSRSGRILSALPRYSGTRMWLFKNELVVRISNIDIFHRYLAILIEMFRYYEFLLNDYACMSSLDTCHLTLGTKCEVDTLVSTFLDCGFVRSLISPVSAQRTFKALNQYWPCYLREINRARIVSSMRINTDFCNSRTLKTTSPPATQVMGRKIQI